jgi:hypothetical protein
VKRGKLFLGRYLRILPYCSNSQLKLVGFYASVEQSILKNLLETSKSFYKGVINNFIGFSYSFNFILK